MPVIAVIGAQWGDEGKGKVVDMLAARADMVVRFSGGDNAGHTVINPLGKFALTLVPSGILSAETVCVMGNGMAIYPAMLLEEMDALAGRGIDLSGLRISDRANIIMPYHRVLDGLEEKARGGDAIGTTGRGIGPAFADKTARLGIRAGDLLNAETFRRRLAQILEYKNAIITKIFGGEALSIDEIHAEYLGYAERLRPYICETTRLVAEAIEAGDEVLLEGAQGTLLDPDFGTYPFCTSSSPLAGSGALGAGIGPRRIDAVVGIFKSYCSRVGAGPFPTELNDEMGALIRERGAEFGTVTGRPRRCGWFDAVAARFSNRVNGFSSIALTRLDILDGMPSLKICTGYELDGQRIEEFPAGVNDLDRCRPILEELPPWQGPISGVRERSDLPAEARAYVDRVEDLIDSPVSIISVGAAREQTIICRSIV
jgi:adenylosuccinate synthase